MTEWLIETLVWTGVLIALVLLVRLPVGRYLGPKSAYALWSLPLLRLLLPPVVLPSWLAPEAATPAAAQIATETFVVIAEPVGATAATAAPVAWVPILLAVWLVGAAGFLALRFHAYFQMRRELLAQGRPVGEAGAVRIIESPAATAPLAFGVLDKVVALPPGFMALTDRRLRDLALEHELAHHSSHDLLANMAVQPLFALHWFNPLAWLGWRAMRRDQEAACDARVVSQHSAEERANYATVIASFAAGPAVALAAPMACPVLGDKSIIHRLRSLTMNDISPRRRLAGRGILLAALLALPLTASISYADAATGPDAGAPPAPPAPPPAPSAPSAPEAPEPPAPPSVAEAMANGEFETVYNDADKDGSGKKRHVIIMRSKSDDGAAPKDGEVRRVIRFTGDSTAEGHDLQWKEVEIRLRDLDDLKELESLKSLKELEQLDRLSAIELKDADSFTFTNSSAAGTGPKIIMACKSREAVSSSTANGKQAPVVVCQKRNLAEAAQGLRKAREEIAGQEDLSKEIRTKILASLDAEIARLTALKK